MSQAVIVTNMLGAFCADGGRLVYLPVEDEDGKVTHYDIVGMTPDGEERRVLVSATGNQKTVRSLASLIQLHRQLFPDDERLTLSLRPDANSIGDTKRRT